MTLQQRLDSLNCCAPFILRFGLGFVFMWFGWSGLVHPELWTGLVPAWMDAIISAEILVRLHGIFELIGGLLLFAGIYTRLVAALLGLSLLQTIFLLGYNAITVRDIGLFFSLVTLATWRSDSK